MLIIIRSDINTPAKFKKGDKLVSANVLGDGTIEYVINRPVKSYVIYSIVMKKYMKKDISKEQHHKTVDIVDEATFFKTYKAAKDFVAEQFGNENHPDINIIEVTE